MSAQEGVDRVRVVLGEDQRITLTITGDAEPVDLSDVAGPLVEVGLDGPRPVGRDGDVTLGVLEAPDDLRVEDRGRPVDADEAMEAIAAAIIRILVHAMAPSLPPVGVGVTDLRRRLGFWIDEVVRGRRLLVTVRQRPAAIMEPVAPAERGRSPGSTSG